MTTNKNTLVIDAVNFKLLERQRLILGTIDPKRLSKKQMIALDGIQNMLDTWSDDRFYNK